MGTFSEENWELDLCKEFAPCTSNPVQLLRNFSRLGCQWGGEGALQGPRHFPPVQGRVWAAQGLTLTREPGEAARPLASPLTCGSLTVAAAHNGLEKEEDTETREGTLASAGAGER